MDTIFNTPKSQKAIDAEIVRLTEALAQTDPSKEEYKAIVSNLRVLCESRGIKSERGLSAEVLFAGLLNVGLALLVMNFEKTGVITTKAFGFLGKGKL